MATSEAVERVNALLRCGHVAEFTHLVNIGDVVHCVECGGEPRKVWFTPGVHKYHCLGCKSATRSLIPAAVRGKAAQHAFQTGHETVYYVEGNEREVERFHDAHHGRSRNTAREAH